MTMLDKIRAVQTAVGVESDGIPGARTWNAIFSRICGEQVVQIVDSGWRADERSERNIAGLQAPLQAIARAFLRECLSEGIEAKIICGLRTFKEQDALYNKGRGEPGRIVTYARGGQSWHNYGLAFDIGLSGERITFRPHRNTQRLGRLAETSGLNGAECGIGCQTNRIFNGGRNGQRGCGQPRC